MAIRDYVRVLRERWRVALATFLVCMIATLAIVALVPATYTATSTLYVVAQTGSSAGAAFEGNLLSQLRVTSYGELATSPRVTREVSRALALGDPDEVARRITTTSAPGSVLLDVAVEDRDARRAAATANAVGEALVKVVTDLERPAQAAVAPPVALRVVQPATPPTTPSSMGRSLMIGLGALAGLVIAFVVALVRDTLDTSVRSVARLTEAAGTGNLGVVVADPRVAAQPLVVRHAPHSTAAEAFRQLRTNLQFVDVDDPPRTIAVTSSLPAEGKTTVVVNLAAALAATGRRVLVVDADLRRPRVADVLGLERSVGLTTVLTGRTSIDRAIQPWGDGHLDILTAGALPPNPSELLASANMATVVQTLRGRFDAVVIDTPPLLPVTDAAVATRATDGAILVCRYGSTTTVQVADAAAALRAAGAPVIGTVLTMVPSSDSDSSAYEGERAPRPTEQASDVTTSPRGIPVPAPPSPRRHVAYDGSPRRPVPHRRADR